MVGSIMLNKKVLSNEVQHCGISMFLCLPGMYETVTPFGGSLVFYKRMT